MIFGGVACATTHNCYGFASAWANKSQYYCKGWLVSTHDFGWWLKSLLHVFCIADLKKIKRFTNLKPKWKGLKLKSCQFSKVFSTKYSWLAKRYQNLVRSTLYPCSTCKMKIIKQPSAHSLQQGLRFLRIQPEIWINKMRICGGGSSGRR